MKPIEEYRESIKRAYVVIGVDAEKENEKYIEWLVERERITSDQRQHLERFNKNIAKNL